MIKEEHQSAVLMAASSAKALAEHDLPMILDRIKRAETVAPPLDPTLYMEKGQALREDKEMLEAALPLWRLGKKFQERAKKRGEYDGPCVCWRCRKRRERRHRSGDERR